MYVDGVADGVLLQQLGGVPGGADGGVGDPLDHVVDLDAGALGGAAGDQVDDPDLFAPQQPHGSVGGADARGIEDAHASGHQGDCAQDDQEHTTALRARHFMSTHAVG